MIKHILSIIFLAACLFCPTQRVVATPAVEIIEIDVLPINISVNGSSLRVTGAAGMALYVYNVTGVRVMSLKVDGSDKTYNLNLPQGCYIVKVGDVVRKISVR
jgi:hypothetical protein